MASPLNKKTINQFNEYMYQWFKEVFSINAELMFAGLCSLDGHRVAFAHSDKSYDYDFLINGIPVQVKANIIYRGNHNRVNEHLECVQEIIKMSLDGSLTLQYIENEIIKFIRVNYLDPIRKAIEQKARIVFIDGTQSAVGFALNKWASYQDNDRFAFEKSLSAALMLYETDSNVFPVIFAAGAYDYNYRFSSICLRIPIVKTENEFAIDNDNLDLINLIK